MEKISEILPEFKTVWICRAKPGPALSADKNDRVDAPPIPLRKFLELQINGTRGSSQGVQVHWQLLYLCLTTHRLLRSYEDGTTALSLIQ